MAIKEALERRPEDRQRRVVSVIDFQTLNSERMLDVSRSLHREMHAHELLGELSEVIKPDFPDVKIGEQKWADGSFYLVLMWNFQSDHRVRSWDYAKNSIGIGVNPLSEDLAVMGKEVELLDRSRCKSDPRLLEDAIVRAYQNPRIQSGPPMRF